MKHESRFELDFALTSAELAAFQKQISTRAYQKIRPFLRATVMLFAAFLSVLIIVSTVGYDYSGPVSIAVAIGMVLGIIYMHVSGNAMQAVLGPDIEKGSTLRRTRLCFTDDRLVTENAGGEAFLFWSNLYGLAEYTDLYAIHMDSYLAILIPKRVFKNTEDEQCWLTFISERLTPLD